MDDVRFVEVADEQTVADWQRIHNAIIPTDPLSLDEVRERSGRHRLELAYVEPQDRVRSGTRRCAGRRTTTARW